MSYYHWLIKKVIWPITRQNRVRQESKQRDREEEGGVWETPAAAAAAWKQDVR